MKWLTSVLMLLLAVSFANAQQVADSFIWPVIGDNTTMLYHNTLDPRLGEAGNLSATVSQPVEAATPGGWFDIGNPFGNYCSSCPGGSSHPYHPGTDFNRYDQDENSGNDVHTLNIADGRVIRIHNTSTLGWSVSIRYEFPGVVDLSDYVLSGTTPTSVIQNATGVVAFYFHIADNVLNSATSEWTSWGSGETLNLNKGATVGFISSQDSPTLKHLHFELRAVNSTVSDYDASREQYSDASGGYYASQQDITDHNTIDPVKFLNEFMVGRYPNVGWDDVNGVSSQFKSVYDNNGGYASLGSIWDRTSQSASDKYALIHDWPDGGGPDVLKVQDLLQIERDDNDTPTDYTDDTFKYTWSQLVNKPGSNNVYLVSDKYGILSLWHNNSGYSLFGAPTSVQQDLGNLMVQYFENGWIEYDKTTTALVGKNSQGFQIALVVDNSIQIVSNPLGAGIYNNLGYLGATPFTLFLSEGESMDLTAKLNGYYDKEFTIDWNDGGQVVLVELEPTSTGSGGTGGALDIMVVTPNFLDFGSIGTERSMTISKETTQGDINWSANPSQSWITVNPSSGPGVGGTGETVSVTIDRQGLSGLYEENITINSTAGTINIPVIVDVNTQFNSPQTYTFDNQTDLNDWQVIDRGVGQSGLDNGQLKLDHPEIGSSGGRSEAILQAPGSIFESVEVTFTFDNGVSENSNQATQFYICWQDQDNYYAWSNAEGSGSHSAALSFVRVQQAVQTTISSWPGALPSGTYVLSHNNDQIRLRDNQGGMIFDQSVNDDNLKYGRIGFGVNEETTWFDNVTVAGITANFLIVDKISLHFNAEDIVKTLNISSLAADELDWWVESKPSWLITNPEGGTSPSSVILTLNTDGLQAGDYSGDLLINSAGGFSTIAVSLTKANTIFSDDFARADLGSNYNVEGWVDILNGEMRLRPQTPPNSQSASVILSAVSGLENTYLEFDWYQTNTDDNRNTTFYFYADADNYYGLDFNRDSRFSPRFKLFQKFSGLPDDTIYELFVAPAHGRYRWAVRHDTLSLVNINTLEVVFDNKPAVDIPSVTVKIATNEETAFIDNLEICNLDDTTPPPPPPSQYVNLLDDEECNGPWDPTGESGWAKKETGDCTVSFSSNNPLSGTSSILVHNPAQKAYNAIEVEQKFDLINGHDYQISFIIQNSQPGPYEATIDIYTTTDWTPQNAWHPFNVTDQRQVESYTFTAVSQSPSVMWIQIGQVVGDLKIDSVWVKDLTAGGGNQSPVANNDNAATDQDMAVEINVPANDSDPDGSLDLTTVTIVQDVNNGSTAVNSSTGIVAYTPNTGFTGSDSFTYTIKDNDGASSNEATVSITVNNTGYVNLLDDEECTGPWDPTGESGWNKDEGNGSTISFTTVNPLSGISSILVQNPAPGAYNSVEVEQILYPTAGQEFRVTFLIQGSNPGPYNAYADIYTTTDWTPQNAWYQYQVTDQLQEISYTFTANKSDRSVIWLQVGEVAGDTRIDLVKIEDLSLSKKSHTQAESEKQLPTTYALHQNYPNPFNPETHIGFDIPEPGQVTLEIYNILGQKVSTLVDATLLAGSYSFIWSSQNDHGRVLPSGVYIYQLQAGQFAAKKKMLLMK